MMIEIFRQYLEIKSYKELKESTVPKNFSNLEVKQFKDFQINKFFYKQIGKKHRWIDRLTWTDQVWQNYINNKFVKTFVLMEKKNYLAL